MAVSINADVITKINYACIGSKNEQLRKVFNKLSISSDRTGSFFLRISIVPEVMAEYACKINLEAGKALELYPEMIPNDKYYRESVLEPCKGEIKIEVMDLDNNMLVMDIFRKNVDIDSYLHWDAARAVSLCGFVQPNEPHIDSLLHDIGKKLNDKENTILVGYQWGGGDSVRKQIQCTFEVLSELDLHYANPPAGYTMGGQKVRTPAICLDDGACVGTCLDLAVLMASLIEQMGLHACIFVTQTHAFAGAWLYPEDFPSAIIDTLQKIKEAVDSGKLLPVECTMFADGGIRRSGFEEAVAEAKKKIAEVLYVIDVHTARRYGYETVFKFTSDPKTNIGVRTEEKGLTKTGEKKLELLKKQALETVGKSGLVSDYHSEGIGNFQVPAEKVFNGKLQSEELNNIVKNSFINNKNGEAEWNRLLRSMHMVVRDEKKEKGYSNLYLALNRMHWEPEKSTKYVDSPLILYPVRIEKNSRGEYYFNFPESRGLHNPVLAELLSEDYGIDISDAQKKDEYFGMMEAYRYIIEKHSGWRVDENVASIGMFRVPNENVYRALDSKRITQNALTLSLLNGEMRVTPEKDYDEDTAPDNDVYALQSDSSQNEVIRAARRQPAMIGMASAGNGKSQTNVNIICDYILSGKHVLLLCEKPTGLEVISEQMRKIGLDPFMLQITEGKTTADDVVYKLRETSGYLDHHEQMSVRNGDELAMYTDSEKRLLKFYHAMSEVGESGKTAAELFEMHERYKNLPVTLDSRKVKEMPRLEMGVNLVSAYANVVEFNKLKSEYRKYLKSTPLSLEERDDVRGVVRRTLEDFTDLMYYGDELENELGLDLKHYGNKRRISLLCTYASILQMCPVYNIDIRKASDSLKELEEDVRREMISELEKLENYAQTSRNYQVHKRYFTEDYYSILPAADRELLENDDIEVLMEDLRSGDTKIRSVDRRSRMVEDIGRLETMIRHEAHDVRDEKALIDSVYSIASGKGNNIQATAERLIAAYQSFSGMQAEARELVVEDIDAFRAEHPDDMIEVLLREWLKDADNSAGEQAAVRAFKEAEKAGIGSLIEQFNKRMERKNIGPDEMVDAFKKCWCEYHIRRVRIKYPELDDFNHVNHSITLRTFKEMEAKLRDNYCRKVSQTVIDNIYASASAGRDTKSEKQWMQERGKLQKYAFAGRKHRTTIRNILSDTKHVITEWYPLIMMTPGAFSEHVPEDFPDFDIVIIDEAGQTPAYRVLYPISMAKKLCIFGDDHQLAPTGYFQKHYEEDGELLPAESIMESAVAASVPRYMLKFHYRSESEDLVAFSNEKYYHNEIVTFPSPKIRERGIESIFVQDGSYDRGGKKVNAPEAVKVIETVRKVMEQCGDASDETIGIIAVNYPQTMLISNMLLKEASGDEKMERWLDRQISVVNLESCQGREWDHVILSLVYGPDRQGKVSGNLGVFTYEGGDNRMNVMITRARKKMYVVTSLKREMLSVTGTKGVRDLRDFIAFASGNYKIDKRSADMNTRGEGILASVAEEFEKRGYIVHTNIGSSRCKVDIGIISKTNPDNYSLGILLDRFDAPRYHVKDTEVIMPQVLEEQGWNIYRLHSINWYDNSAYEMDEMLRVMRRGR